MWTHSESSKTDSNLKRKTSLQRQRKQLVLVLRAGRVPRDVLEPREDTHSNQGYVREGKPVLRVFLVGIPKLPVCRVPVLKPYETIPKTSPAYLPSEKKNFILR